MERMSKQEIIAIVNEAKAKVNKANLMLTRSYVLNNIDEEELEIMRKEASAIIVLADRIIDSMIEANRRKKWK